MQGGIEVQLHYFLTSSSGPGRFNPGKELRCSLKRRLGGLQRLSGLLEKGDKGLSCRDSNHGLSGL
jgi:hypothetical protein